MSISRLLTQDVDILPYQEDAVDEHNDPTPSFGSAVTVKGFLEQATPDEKTGGDRETAVSSWRVFLPADTEIGYQDRVQVGDKLFAVDGTPHDAWNPRTEQTHHIEARLVLLEG